MSMSHENNKLSIVVMQYKFRYRSRWLLIWAPLLAHRKFDKCVRAIPRVRHFTDVLFYQISTRALQQWHRIKSFKKPATHPPVSAVANHFSVSRHIATRLLRASSESIFFVWCVFVYAQNSTLTYVYSTYQRNRDRDLVINTRGISLRMNVVSAGPYEPIVQLIIMFFSKHNCFNF